MGGERCPQRKLSRPHRYTARLVVQLLRRPRVHCNSNRLFISMLKQVLRKARDVVGYTRFLPVHPHRVAALVFLVVAVMLSALTLFVLRDYTEQGAFVNAARCDPPAVEATQAVSRDTSRQVGLSRGTSRQVTQASTSDAQDRAVAADLGTALVCRMLHLLTQLRTTRVPLAAMLACLGSAYVLVMCRVRRAFARAESGTLRGSARSGTSGMPGAAAVAGVGAPELAIDGGTPRAHASARPPGSTSFARLQHSLKTWGPHTARIVIDSLEHDIVELAEALRRADAGQIGQLAHRIEGAAATLGVLPAKSACEAIRGCIEYEWTQHAFALTTPLIGILRSTAADASRFPAQRGFSGLMNQNDDGENPRS